VPPTFERINPEISGNLERPIHHGLFRTQLAVQNMYNGTSNPGINTLYRAGKVSGEETMTLRRSLTGAAFGFAFLYIFVCGTDPGIATAQTTPTCTAALLTELSLALQREQIAKRDFEEDRISRGTVNKLRDAAGSLSSLPSLISSCLAANEIASDTAELCEVKVGDAQSLDNYLANVAGRAVNSSVRNFASITFIPFLDDRETQLNLLNRSIELKKDCLQALITEGAVDGTEEPTRTTLP
jgi:hypothetical protein